MNASTFSFASRARTVIPGGVNSPVRAFQSVGGDPLFAARGEGAYLHTVDGRKLIDFCLSFGPMVLGHADPEVVDAVREAAGRGTSYGITTEGEIEMAELLCGAIPAMDKVRLVNSGTEAVMTALRLARGATGRRKILKFSGCYHGHSDAMLVQAGSGLAGAANASSAGVTAESAGDTLVARLNDVPAVEAVMREHGPEVAAIVVEPIAANMGLVLPEAGYLERLRVLCDEAGALLIFDEVITGFRFTFGAYANVCGVKPDLITLGKIIGGGLPIGAVGGGGELMDLLSPDGPVYQAGTLSGNPLCVAAGLATLRKLRGLDPYEELAARCQRFTDALRRVAREKGVEMAIPNEGSVFSLFFRATPPRSFEEAQGSDTEEFARVFQALLARGVYLAPSGFEAGFLSVCHDDALLERVVEAWEDALSCG